MMINKTIKTTPQTNLFTQFLKGEDGMESPV
jgi:hypothetical protein